MLLQEIKEIRKSGKFRNGESTIGLTGGIGSGKSIVSRILRCQGMEVYDCDTEAKRLMTENPEVVCRLKEVLGDEAYTNKGELNKGFISRRLFSEKGFRERVNKIVHTAVENDIQKRLNYDKGPFFIESAILASSHIDRICDEIWIVETGPEERIERIGKRDGLSKEEILKRIEAQKEEIEKLEAKETFILRNDRDTPLLIPVLNLLYETEYNDLN